MLEWVAISPSRRSSQPREWTHVSWGFCIAGEFFTAEQLEKRIISKYPSGVLESACTGLGLYCAGVSLRWLGTVLCWSQLALAWDCTVLESACTGLGLYWDLLTVHISPHFTFGYFWGNLKMVHSGRVYTVGIGKYYRSGFFSQRTNY